jgi:hypothetical protein
MQAIVDAITAWAANVDPFTAPINKGAFKNSYIGNHGNWYHDLHADVYSPDRCVAGGHIHLG